MEDDQKNHNGRRLKKFTMEDYQKKIKMEDDQKNQNNNNLIQLNTIQCKGCGTPPDNL